MHDKGSLLLVTLHGMNRTDSLGHEKVSEIVSPAHHLRLWTGGKELRIEDCPSPQSAQGGQEPLILDLCDSCKNHTFVTTSKSLS